MFSRYFNYVTTFVKNPPININKNIIERNAINSEIVKIFGSTVINLQHRKCIMGNSASGKHDGFTLATIQLKYNTMIQIQLANT